MKGRLLLMLFVGVVFGGSMTYFFPLVKARAFASRQIAVVHSVFSDDEDHAAPDAEEHTLLDEATTTPSLDQASATSSPRSIKIPVLIYHSVRAYIPGESKMQDAYDITPELLEQELNYIAANGFTTVTFADVNEYFDNGTPLPAKPVILSFDDGWRNQYEHAFPLLKQYHMKGTFFIFTNPIDHGKPHWMSWGQIKELDQAGMEIVGHTRTHPVLTKITTQAGLDKEIAGSKKIIETELGHPIAAFAYPFGAYDPQVETAVKRAGYTLARTVDGKAVWNDPAHRFEFHGKLASDHFSDFVALLNKE